MAITILCLELSLLIVGLLRAELTFLGFWVVEDIVGIGDGLGHIRLIEVKGVVCDNGCRYRAGGSSYGSVYLSLSSWP